MSRFRFWLWGWLLFPFLGNGAALAQVGVASFGVAPVETIRLSRPQLVWRVAPNIGNIREVRMTLNGRSVAARYLPEKRCALATLDSSLSPGPYDVHCELIMESGRTYPKNWSFTVGERPLAKPPAITPEAQAGAAVINELRQKMGLPPFTLDERLCAAATESSRALAQYAPNEPPSELLAGTLVKAFCYPGPCFECIGMSFHPVATIIRSFFDAPYHRSPFLQPGSCDVGIGVAGDRERGQVVTLLFSLCDETGVVVYPRDGQKEIPVDWDPSEEDANPLKVHGVLSRDRVGYPITLFAQGPYGIRLEDIKADLTTEAGIPVPFYLNSPDNDKDNLDNGVILIPRQPLKPGITYRVRVLGKDDHEEPVMHVWRFTTTATVHRTVEMAPPPARSGSRTRPSKKRH